MFFHHQQQQHNGKRLLMEVAENQHQSTRHSGSYLFRLHFIHCCQRKFPIFNVALNIPPQRFGKFWVSGNQGSTSTELEREIFVRIHHRSMMIWLHYIFRKSTVSIDLCEWAPPSFFGAQIADKLHHHVELLHETFGVS